MSTQTGNLGLYRNETVDDTLVALVNNQNINMNIIDSNVQQNINKTTQLDWQIATVVGREIQVSKPTSLKSVKFQLESDIVAGTVITISTDGGVSSLPLKDIEEADILELEKGFYEVIADATFFTLRPSGGNSFGAYAKYEGFTTVLNAIDTGGTVQNIGTDSSDEGRGIYFTTSKSGTIQTLEVNLWRVGNPTDNVIVAIYETSSNLPTGLHLGKEIITGSTISTSTNNIQSITLDASVELTQGQVYAVIIERDGSASGSNFYRSHEGIGSSGLIKNTSDVWSSNTSPISAKVIVGETQIALKTDGNDAEVKTGQYIIANHSVFIDDGASGQTIPSVDNATSESQLQATINGTLKTDTSYTTGRQVVASVFKNAQGFTTL